jgi:hypothetical protein
MWTCYFDHGRGSRVTLYKSNTSLVKRHVYVYKSEIVKKFGHIISHLHTELLRINAART